MLKTLRTALTAAGGAQTLIAIAAVAWGLGRLQSIAEERQAQIAQLDAHLAERLDLARAEAAARHPSAHAAEDVPVSQARCPRSDSHDEHTWLLGPDSGHVICPGHTPSQHEEPAS